MRSHLLLILFVLAGCDGPKTSPPIIADPVGPKFKVGDAVPPINVTAWLQGDPVAIKPGQVTVIDFWATWCGPCLKAMPRINEKAKLFGPQGVTFIGHTTADATNTRDAVEKYLRENAGGYAIHFAFSETQEMVAAWMGAAGRVYLPCCMVVDKAGKLAFIGGPDDLDAVLPKVLAGVWRGQADVDELNAADKEFAALLLKVDEAGSQAAWKLGPNADATALDAAKDQACHAAAVALLGTMDQYLRDHPWNASQNDVKAKLMGFYIRARQFDRARPLAESTMAWAIEMQNTAMLEELRLTWLKRRYNPERKHIDISVKAAEAILKMLGDGDVRIVLNAADSYQAAGDKVRYEEMAAKARSLEKNNPARLQKVEDALRSFQ